MAEAITEHAENVSAPWDARRRAALSSLTRTALHDSPLYGYFTRLHGYARASDLNKTDLGLGEQGPVLTNAAILRLNQQDMPALEFFDAALSTIREQNARRQDAVGPENYATAIKFFVDKKAEQDVVFDEPALGVLRTLTARWVNGFAATAQKDAPNFVELNNIYSSISRLPRNAFPPEFTPLVIRHSLEALPTFDRKATVSLLNAVSRLDPDQAPQELAMLSDLTITMLGQFERTVELRVALRAIRNLKPGEPAHNALRAVYDNAARLEEPLDMDGLDEVSHSLRVIVDNAIDDPALTIQAQQMAESCARKAVAAYRLLAAEENLEPERLHAYKLQVDRIVNNWRHI